MSDRQSGHGRKKNRLWILLIVVIVVLLGIVIAINQGGHEQEPSTEQTDENETVDDVQTAETNEEETEPSEETDTGLEFPYLLDGDKIQNFSIPVLIWMHRMKNAKMLHRYS